jgi:hypothetical protein
MSDDQLLLELANAVFELKSTAANLKHITNSMAAEVLRLNAALKHLPCIDLDPSEATQPDCPVLTLRPPHAVGDQLDDIENDDGERHSVVTEQVSVHAGPLTMRGPGIMLVAITIIGIAGAVVWAWVKARLV